ncbi:MAG: class I adenylate-forming enzyme family protein [Spirochaetes bacterium]|nr:class I adenylate-forming enzyme family protein [Spirochaetota bacterium]
MLSTRMTMSDALRAVVEARPNQEVFICGRTRLTNRQLMASVDSLARGLAGLRVRKGDWVAALLPPGPEFVFLFFAVAALGAVIVPLNPDLRERALGDILADAAPTTMVTMRTVDDAILRQAPSLRRILDAGGRGSGTPLASIMEAGPADLELPAVAPDDLLALLYTSGTTGKPKATMHTHSSLIAPVVASLKVRELWLRPSSLKILVDAAKALMRYRSRMLRSIGRPQTIMSTMGWHTITGLYLMLQGLLMGDRLAVLPRFHPYEALELVQRERVTVLVAVPTAYQAILALPDPSRFDTSSLFVCATGGAACPPALAREIQSRFKCALYNGFGMTEMGGGVTVCGLEDSDEQQAESVGRPMVGVELRIVDEQRRDLPGGQVGELAVRGEGVMKGYYHAPELTAAVLDAEGWLYTGDMARIDDEGYLHIVGRKKDVIVRGGQNIYPAEIEHHLETHPLIEKAAVVGVPSAVGGESVWAFVRLKGDARMTVREVLDHCRGRLEIYKIPSQVRFVSEIPEGEMGKTQKYKLRAAALQETAGGAS